MRTQKRLIKSICLIFIIITGCNKSDLGIKGKLEYSSYMEINSIKFITQEVLADLPKYLTGNKSQIDIKTLENITYENLFIAAKVCKWTPQFGDFDYPINLPSFDCYNIPNVDLDYEIVDIESFQNSNKSTSYLLIASKPLVYEWGGYIEVILYSKKFGVDNPVFFIIQKDNNMYLHSTGSISGLPAR
ncbi:hypothetical protein C900_00512 [Fulvivirga imtechensis AK7]|uniref:Lipoprotein n=1 Tax=Fulvivirga imtechensis AK7 TaxID=1237149 RepID=L8JHL5_9BACT|nr:hypothetical protein [Fulvivirga imtechensis]ELR68341.1 hypothetical protein C900_00512 [Fulvivirga imtechensis AK7]